MNNFSLESFSPGDLLRLIGSQEKDLTVFSSTSRFLLQLLIYPIISIGFIGNLGVLIRILIPGKTALKPFYRSSLISLAISDLLLLGTSGTNVLALLSNRTILWSLKNWSCQVLPYLQTIAVLVASLTLTGVAIDRYTAFKSKCSVARGPGWITTVAYVILVWSVAAGASYPVLDLYEPQSLIIINNMKIYTGYLCIANREKAKAAYMGLFIVIFLPLAIVFLVVHVLLAMSILNRKWPGQCGRAEASLSAENSTASTNIGKPKPNRKLPTPTHVTRKRRTVRVILLLILIFSVCRIPHWAFLLFKLHTTVSGRIWWHIQVIFTALSLLDAAMHPFLYAFLNEALSIVNWIRLICRKNGESRDLESSESRIKEGSYSAGVKVPRGPYCP